MNQKTSLEAICYQGLFQCHDAILLSDESGRVIFANKAFTDMYGYELEEIQGRPMEVVFFEESPSPLKKLVRTGTVKKNERVWKGELRAKLKDGNALDISLTITPIYTEVGDPVAFMSTSHRVSEHRKLESRLAEQEKLSAIGLLASGIAHEIGSPLNVISGRAEMTKALVADNPDAGKGLEIIYQQTERIGKLVQALLSFSKPAHLATPDQFKPVLLGEVLSECRRLTQTALESQGVEFTVTEKTKAAVLWDFNKGEQVFINLIQNAIHALEHTTNPAIEVVIEPGGDANLATLEVSARECVLVSVRDNGQGIPPQNLKRVFDPFFTTKDIGVGTGLGLSVVFGLVKEIEGSLHIDSAPGQGTTVTLVLPVAAD